MDYAHRIANLGLWFQKHHKELERLIDKQNVNEAASQITEQLKHVYPNVHFKLYKTDHYYLEFETLMDDVMKLLVEYTCKHVGVDGWKLILFHQKGIGKFVFQETVFEKEQFEVLPYVNKTTRQLRLTIVGNEALNQLSKEDQYFVMYMLLIDVLGEYDFLAMISGYEIIKKRHTAHRFKKVVMMSELHQWIVNNDDLPKNLNMDKQELIGERYQRKTASTVCYEDMVEGISYSLDLLNKDSQSIEFLKSCGVRYCSIVMDTYKKELTDHEQMEYETMVHEIVSKIGRIIHVAQGNRYRYIDCLVFSDSGYQKVQEVIRNHDATIKEW